MNSAEILGLFAWLEENDQSLDLGLIRDVLQQNQEPVDSSHQKAIRDYTARSVGIRTTLDLDDDWDTLNLVWGPVHTALLQQAPALWGPPRARPCGTLSRSEAKRQGTVGVRYEAHNTASAFTLY